MLTGNLINLRALERDDLERCWTWMNDAEVTQFLAVPQRPISRVEEEKWLENAMTQRDDECVFAITTKDGTHIGNCGLMCIDHVARHAALGIMIGDKDYWGRGYGADAVNVLLRYAFEVLNLNRVYLRVHAYNLRGIRCYEKCGFQHEGRLRQQVYRHGRYWDTLVMGMLREEWESRSDMINATQVA
ncbi:MAG: GNAT family N-acetyltransferase [Abditibacteriales bacterium]|nr:GNAT family N-acetyltransferase [Abditibacteriales bacterium]MDW8364280.1 GNAT family protein [Abditibacteriales bacterium]